MNHDICEEHVTTVEWVNNNYEPINGECMYVGTIVFKGHEQHYIHL